MRPAFWLCASADPEERLVFFAKSGVGVGSCLLRRHLHHHTNAERLERVDVKGLRPLHIGDGKADMVNHEWTSSMAPALTGWLVAAAQGSCYSALSQSGRGASGHEPVGRARQ